MKSKLFVTAAVKEMLIEKSFFAALCLTSNSYLNH